MSRTKSKKTQKKLILGQRLKKARDITGLSQEKFAIKLGYEKYDPIKSIETGVTELNPRIAKLIQYEFGISEKWLLEGKGDMLIEVYERPIDSQELLKGIVAEIKPPYGEKLLPEEKKFAEIKAFMETIQAAGPPGQALFNEKFIECFKSFEDWSKRRHCATEDIIKDEENTSDES